MRTKTILAVGIPLAAVFVSGVIANRAKSAQRPTCTTSQEPGFTVSWQGQPGTPDHSESRPIKQGMWIGCWAEAQGLEPQPACFLSYESGGHYTLPPRTAMKSPITGVVTLRCNGNTPTCCKIQTAGALSELKKNKAFVLNVLVPKDAQTKGRQ